MNSRHLLLDREEYRSFWEYWNHGYSCPKCHPQLCKAGQELRESWKEALDVLEGYEDGTLKWIVKALC